MAQAVTDIEETILSLEPEQRARLAALLIESLEADDSVDEKELSLIHI